MMAVLASMVMLTAWSFPISNYATSSKLSSGYWVKISVPADGVYELTAEELSQMGFDDISHVSVFGYGGHMLSEVLTGTHKDDLTEVPTLLVGNKICFYGYGPLKMSLNTDAAEMPYFTRVVNAYSLQGYYFLTESESPLRVEDFDWVHNINVCNYSTSYNWFLHERELTTITKSGKDLLGERIIDMPCTFEYNLPNLAQPKLMVLTCLGVAASSSVKGAGTSASVTVISDGVSVPINYSNTRIDLLEGTCRYMVGKPVASVDLPSVVSNGVIQVNNVEPYPQGANVSVSLSYLDYVLVTYEQRNSLDGVESNQIDLCLPMVNAGDTITVSDASSSVVMWNLDGPKPVNLQRREASDQAIFTSPLMGRSAKFVAFDPTRSLRHIVGYEVVENQNIHGAATPDYIIFTDKDFEHAADRLAELHRKHDGLDVLVVTQEQVFNEFSSGTPDAMALRLMCKMFYDRSPGKLKYLLLFGGGLHDNRQLISHKDGVLITYETDNSYNDSKSYSADDFYGILGDGTGELIAKEPILLGVGRLTPQNAEEANGDVDKIIKYVTDPNFGPWRNNAFIMADQGDDDLHVYQAEGLCNVIKDNQNILLDQYKAYIPFFPKATDELLITEANRSSPAARSYTADAFSTGMYFSSYIGHAGASVFTKSSKLWRTTDVNNTRYKHFPIMTTACCDVARFDSPGRGIAEHMIHKLDGGAIALLTSSRSVSAINNDLLNVAFTKAFFTLNNDGTMSTLGDVTRKAKRSFTSENHNKMMFLLLGDPAIKINYPLPLINVTKLNNEVVGTGDVPIASMQYLEVEADVLNRNSNTVDQSFTGEATLTLYDAERFCFTTDVAKTKEPRDIYYPRTMLAQTDAKVVNGKIKGKILVPNDLGWVGGKLRLSVYAHKAGTTQMANGQFNQLVVGTGNPDEVVTDNVAPVIEQMYFDDAATFSESQSTTTDGTLYIMVTDETALSMASGMTGDMKLILDGGSESYYLVRNNATISNEGKRIDIALGMSDLTPGRHTITYQVQDVAGNTTSKTINFVVEQPINLDITVNEMPASQEATFTVSKNLLPMLPELTFRVTDVLGNIVWQKTTTQLPCKWNLLGLDGQRVPNGVYRFWATYDDDTYYGGTYKHDLIIVEP